MKYLTPGSGEPLRAALTGAVVAGLGLGGPLGPAALQRQTADVIGETLNAARPHPRAAVGRTLRHTASSSESERSDTHLITHRARLT